MNHRHLLPDEIDLLLDDEVGFGVAPLRAHLRDCVACQARLDEAQFIVAALEDLPHIAPSHAFADRVMAQVPVFVPWHVALRDTVKRWLPESRPARGAMAALAASATSMLTLAILWIGSRADVVALASGAMGARVQHLMTGVVQSVLAAAFGDQMFAIIQRTGTVGSVAALLGLGVLAGAGVAGLRALAAISRKRRG